MIITLLSWYSYTIIAVKREVCLMTDHPSSRKLRWHLYFEIQICSRHATMKFLNCVEMRLPLQPVLNNRLKE